MKKLFLLGIKLMGIHYMVIGFMAFLSLIFVKVPPLASGAESDSMHYAFVANVASSVIPFVVGFLLVSFTSYIGKVIGTTDVSMEIEGVSPKSLLPVGISLIGLSCAISYGRYIVSKLPEFFSQVESKHPLGIADIAGMGVALLLMFKPASVAELIALVKEKGAS